MVTDTDIQHLRRCLELAAEAIDAGDEPFGSVLVGGDGAVLAEDRNRETSEADPTRHPEFALARWAARHLDSEERATATVYTSGEHCPMCAAAHGWVGLGRIVYASSSAQTGVWLTDLGAGPSPVRAIPIQDIAPRVTVEGPVAGLDAEVHELHRRYRLRH
jgi:tRNA(Arg) A34 adenosine deaminase TadA